jgi:hypothetical protein
MGFVGEEDRPLARRLPGGQVRSLQVKLARHTVERDRHEDSARRCRNSPRRDAMQTPDEVVAGMPPLQFRAPDN